MHARAIRTKAEAIYDRFLRGSSWRRERGKGEERLAAFAWARVEQRIVRSDLVAQPRALQAARGVGCPAMTPIKTAPSQGTAAGDTDRSLFVAVLQRQKHVVLAVAVVAVLGSLALTLRQTKTYAATAAVVVQTSPLQPAAAEPNMATEVQIARSLAVASDVRQRLRLTVRPERLLDLLSVRVPVDSTVLKFTYLSVRPEIAQERAQAFANGYLDVRRRQLEDQSLASAASISARIHGMTKQVFALNRRADAESGQGAAILRAQRDAAIQQIGLLQQKLADLNGSATVVSPGSVLGPVSLPTRPVRPRIVFDALLALAIGGLLGFGIAAAREYTNERVRSSRDVGARRGVPVRNQDRPDSGARGAPPKTALARRGAKSGRGSSAR